VTCGPVGIGFGSRIAGPRRFDRPSTSPHITKVAFSTNSDGVSAAIVDSFGNTMRVAG